MSAISKKLSSLEIGQNTILFGRCYKTLMRTIGSYQSRGRATKNLIIKKCQLIIGDDFKVGVYVERVADETS